MVRAVVQPNFVFMLFNYSVRTVASSRGFSDLATALSVVLRNRQKLKKSISIKVTYLPGKSLALHTLLAIFISSIEIPNIVRSENSPCSWILWCNLHFLTAILIRGSWLGIVPTINYGDAPNGFHDTWHPYLFCRIVAECSSSAEV